MRRKEREVTTQKGLQSIIDHCKVCRICLMDGKQPLIYPLNFGYNWEEKLPVLYFHGAKAGKKASLLQDGEKISFEMDCSHELISGVSPCDYSFRYSSIMGSGTLHLLESYEEKKKALAYIMQHQTGKEFAFTEEMTRPVLVFSIAVEQLTGKERV